MINVSILYANKEGGQFDQTYYCEQHIPLVKEKLGSVLRDTRVDIGLAGAAPDIPAPYACIGHLFFDSVDAFQGAFAENAEAIMSDIPNYTNIEPVIQISKIVP